MVRGNTLPWVKQMEIIKVFYWLSLNESLFMINRIVLWLIDVGEILVVPAKAFFKDEISIGMDRQLSRLWTYLGNLSTFLLEWCLLDKARCWGCQQYPRFF